MTLIQIIFALLGAATLIFVLVLIINTAVVCAKARRLKSAPAEPDSSRTQYYAERLSKVIQCKTISVKDSYDDTEFAKLRAVIQEQFPVIHQRAERLTFGDDCWAYCISGDDTSRNIMLMSHHDVVVADGEWKYDAFSGQLAEDKIWGRGTVDTKTPLFAEFSALEELLEAGFQPPCNVWIASSHNEELGGNGIPQALEYFKEKGITFEVILDEGGAVIEPPLGGMKCEKCAMVAVHEKGRYYLNCTAEAGSGHASLTAATQNTPAERMAMFISELTRENIFVRRLNPQIKAMFRALAPYCGFPMNLLLSNLWCFGGILKAVMPKLNPQAGGLIGTTCTISEISTSPDKKKCTAVAFMRPVDEKDLQQDIEAFRSLAQKYGIEVTIAENSEYHAPADIKQPAYRYTMDCIGKIFPQYPASPFILPAGTDARTLTDVCKCVLRFAPIRLSAQQLASVHSENENLDLSAITPCVDFYKLFLQEYK